MGKNFEQVRKNFITCRKTAPFACRIRAEIGGRRVTVTAADRRRAILEVLSLDKFTTRANLAFEFGVSKRTIDHDLLLLSRKYPIYAIQGKDGGIHVMDNFRLDGRYLTEEQMDVLVRLTKEVSESDSCVLRSILKKFGKKKEDRI